jgi:hypothetical protein
VGSALRAVAVWASPFKSKIRLEAENAALRHQLVVLRRKLKGRARFTNNDRWFFVQLYRWFRLERLPGEACIHWKAPPLHGARQRRTFKLITRD